MNRVILLVYIYSLFSGCNLAAENRSIAYIDGNRGWLDNGKVKLAVDKDYGGSIVYASPSDSKENMVNISDLGREIQQSYYAGKDFNRQDNGQSKNWSPWPWNPVQAGNCDRDKSVILNFETQKDNTALYVKCRPRLWDMTEEIAQCYFHQSMQFEDGMDNVICVTNKIECFRDENDIWGEAASRNQELPAVYLIKNMNRLVIYDGDKPWQNDKLTDVTYGPDDKWIWVRRKPTEPWAACVNPVTNIGLGVYSPEGSGNTWNMGWVGKPTGTEYDAATMHFAPINNWSLGRDTVKEFKYWIIIGELDNIRVRVYELHKKYNEKKESSE